ncbi:hypothetical protein J4218_03035 [Candidatus Pacearchaeota archaeon]|nr:hypothetical protein [Candidatus Pacearchaeota archaeon]
MDENLSHDLERFQEDILYFENKKEELRAEFLNKFVAIKNKRIIDSGNSIEELRNRLENNNQDPARIIIEFVPEEETIMIL